MIEADVEIHAMVADAFGHVFERFGAAFARALPRLSPTEVAWRIHFMIAALAFTIDIPRLHHRLDPRKSVPEPRRPAYPRFHVSSGAGESVDLVLRRLVSFVSAGMRAPAPNDDAAVRAAGDPDTPIAPGDHSEDT